nr:GIY-YIG nuclease family protein [Pannonibacter phragmitetus]
MSHFVYILANQPHGAIYVGSTRDLRQRLEQHRAGTVVAHTRRYNIKTLVYFEQHETVIEALHREKRLKRWPRIWKENLITEHNPGWWDVSDQIPY